MIRSFKNTKFKDSESLLTVKTLYPLAYKDFKTYFEQRNPEKTDLFLSIMTRDTYCTEYFLAFYKFFTSYNIVIFSDFDVVINCFNLLNDRLSAIKN